MPGSPSRPDGPPNDSRRPWSARERVDYAHDELGHVIREARRGEWSDDTGAHVDELVVERGLFAAAGPGTGAKRSMGFVRGSGSGNAQVR